jgi:glycosyltransferase involved in cell wall biosynthesis
MFRQLMCLLEIQRELREVRMVRVDVVVAVRNEEESLPLFVQSLRALKIPENIELGCIFIEDSSTDATVDVLRNLSAHDSLVSYICLKRGHGQAPAIALGIRESHADAIIMMDVDGGHPIELIPPMIDAFIGGALAVQAVRRTLENRQGYRDIATQLFNHVYRIATGIDTKKQNVFFRLIARPLAIALLQDNRWKHFLRIRYSGFKEGTVTYVEFDALERVLGVSKYNLRRLLFFALDGVFASISLLRFGIGITSIVVLTLALWIAEMHVVACVVGATAAWCVAKFRQMNRHDVFDLLEVREASLR